MRDLFRIYRGLLKAGLAEALTYRAQVILWILSSIFPLVMLSVWIAVVNEAGPIAGWREADFVAYYIGATFVQNLVSAWVTWQWDDEIRTGDLSARLARPIDPFHQLLTNELGWKLFVLLVFVPLMLVGALLFPALRYPLDAWRALAWVASLVLAFGINMLMGCAFGVLAFWTTQTHNLYGLWIGAGQFLSGWIAPLALFPPWFQRIAAALPFRYTLGFQMELLMGRLTWPEIGAGFLWGLAWLFTFLALYRVLWRRGLRRYEAVGA